MSRRTFARLDASLEQLIAETLRTLAACRRRHRATAELIGDRIPDYTDPDWRVSVPGSGYGSGGGLGTNDPTDVPSVPGQGANDPNRRRGE